MAKEKIVRVTFADSTMMFGNSYKPWKIQFDEYVLLKKMANETLRLKQVEVSDAKWVWFGGLKWCPEEQFQHQLNREGCQSSEPDNPNPRQYSEMKFYEDEKISKQVRDLMVLNLHRV